MIDYYSAKDMDAMPAGSELTGVDDYIWVKRSDGLWDLDGTGFASDWKAFRNYFPKLVTASVGDSGPTLGELVALRESYKSDVPLSEGEECLQAARIGDIDSIIGKRFGWQPS